MILLHPDAYQRAANVRDKARIFHDQHLTRTSARLNRIARYIETGAEANWSNLIDDAVATLREEFCGEDPDTAKQFDFIEQILVKALTGLNERFRNKLVELKPFLDEMQNGVFIMSDISSLILRAPDRTEKEDFYVLCIFYAMAVEGVFDSACRLLYVLYKYSLGQDETYSQSTRNLDLHLVRQRMGELSGGLSDVRFEGYESHLRNAIAHMRFSYEADRRMRLVDDYAEGRPPYDKRWSYEVMLHRFNALRNVWLVFNYLLMILRVHDMAFAAEPFKV